MRQKLIYVGVIVITAAATAGVAALLMNIHERKQEARQQVVQLVELTEETTDPAERGKNFPRE